MAHNSFKLIIKACNLQSDRQIVVRDFKYIGNICPYTQVTWYSACAAAANALSMVACAVGDAI